ncbi:hypothetical protein [Piscirickettsia litoralis]|uniref:hypothetical protein n=1 Tax=Piscirickettsia litoralis TaxID=1891921 RepID=UPI0009811160|nr:hypothetical protein [Piscirickettsia litoralis]
MSQNASPPSQNIFYYTIFFIVAVCALAFYFHEALYSIVLSVKIFEMKLISIFTAKYNDIIEWMYNTPVNAMAGDNLLQISIISGDIIKWVGVVLAVIFIAIIYYFHPQKNLSTRYNMKSLLSALNNSFPATGPVMGESLDKTDINRGDWRMALTPVEFMKINNILDVNKVNDDGRPALNRGKAYQVFVDQLGRFWQGIEALKPHEKAHFCHFFSL